MLTSLHKINKELLAAMVWTVLIRLSTGKHRKCLTIGGGWPEMKIVVIFLCALLLHCEVKAQNKKFACSYEYPGAPEAGYPPDYIPLEVCTHVIFKGFKFPKIVGRQMLFHVSSI